MVFFNYSTMQMAAKVVYYGPGLCGKTTNLQYIYAHTSSGSRGEMVSLETETDRTLFFDLLPIDVGSIGGFSTRIQLYTVPGQVFYNTTRKLVLKGVDGVVFVADSQRPMLQANVESLKNLEENLAELNVTLDSIPLVLQYNKRDLADILSVDELNESLNWHQWPHFESSAITGMGVFESLKGISKLTLLSLKKRLAKGPAAPPPRRPVAQPKPEPKPEPPPAASPAAEVEPPAASPAVEAEPPAASPAAEVEKESEAPPPQSVPQVAAPAPEQEPPPKPETPPLAASRPRSKLDVLDELERIRKQTASAARAHRGGPGGAEDSVNGRSEISRAIRLTLNRDDFLRAHRFLLSLKVEDEEQKVVDSIQNFQVDLGDVQELSKVLLRLSIALHAKE